ncbi:MAG TPA: 4-(cytidine 5'-diphospho)-2-C-methyl-D-erythritol kinase [Nevskiaceae bacterium]|nr:4-(cytidine 5'-diphospho)-2-C-methyl-D-erythritol kinase [Nevskiaceae bacterium]
MSTARRKPRTEALTADRPWPAPAKLNLFLHVIDRRPDGYHGLQTVFQFLDYGDDLFFTPRGDGVIHRLEGPEEIPESQDIVVRAANALAKMAGAGLGADIRVHKRIPIGAGLGGGSSDAATTLVALNRVWNTGFTVDELAHLGLRLGADVPVFVRGIAAWGEGVGERLEPVTLSEPWYLVIVPPVHVSTREIFESADLKRDCPRITLEDFLAGRATNVCEPITRRKHPVVGEALDWLGKHAPARMSGTGGAVFAAFPDRDKARLVQEQAPKQWQSFVARGLNRSPLL